MEIKLGLGPLPIRRYLYVGQDDGETKSCWYEYDVKANVKHPVTEPALTGYITGLRLFEKDGGRFGKKWKLDILMEANGPWAIRSGTDTVFARGVVLSLMAIPDFERLKTEPVIITVSPAPNHAKVVFGRVYLGNGTRVNFEWDKDVDLVASIDALKTIFGDGGIEGDEDIEYDQDHDGQDGSHASERFPTGSGSINASQLTELKRLAGVLGFVRPHSTDLDLESFDQLCGGHFGGRGIRELTFSEAITFRQTLMQMQN